MSKAIVFLKKITDTLVSNGAEFSQSTMMSGHLNHTNVCKI